MAPVLLEPGVPAWLLLSYDANRAVMYDDATFKRDPRKHPRTLPVLLRPTTT